MGGAGPKLISYVVPTLNRGRYVVRAVNSCLTTETPDCLVEVIVLDSQSDDGSFEALTERFGDDPRVKLAQNRRGLGPTHSWLDGAAHVTGQAVTFVWSDDFIAPGFAETLAPALDGALGVAFGVGAIRDIDDETPLPTAGETVAVDPHRLLRDYHLRWRLAGAPPPVSPCSSLFSRRAFDVWREAVPDWCRRTPLRETLLWRRAIGPDLMLYFAGLLESSAPVRFSNRPVAQFSHHAGSITVGASRWPYETGYWLARLWLLEVMAADDKAARARYADLAGLTFGYGLLLWAWALAGRAGLPGAARDMTQELDALLAQARRRGVGGRVFARGVGEAMKYVVMLVPWALRRARGR